MTGAEVRLYTEPECESPSVTTGQGPQQTLGGAGAGAVVPARPAAPNPTDSQPNQTLPLLQQRRLLPPNPGATPGTKSAGPWPQAPLRPKPAVLAGWPFL